MAQKRLTKKERKKQELEKMQNKTSNNHLLEKLCEIEAKTDNQEDLIDSIYDNEITFAIGPAGTGKTFLSLIIALRILLKNKTKYKKIIIARPQIATKKVGFLPGTENEKNAPFIRPILYSLEKIIGHLAMKKLMMENRIETMTLEYMRGCSIDNSIVLLDEAQNLSKAEILMFLTRLGEKTKFIITGDLDQNDLKGDISGLQVAYDRLNNVEGIGMIELDDEDIVRNPLIKVIIERFSNKYEKHLEEKQKEDHQPIKGDFLWKELLGSNGHNGNNIF